MPQEDPLESPFASEAGLEDRSDELEELSEQDIQIRFYQAMAGIHENEPGLVHRLSQAIASVMFDFCAIALRSASADSRFEFAAAHDVNPAIGPAALEMLNNGRVLEDAVIAESLQSETPQTFTAQYDGHLMLRREGRVLNVHSLILVPMRTQQGEVFGMLAVGRHATSRPYDRADVALLEWIATHVGMKLETARLYRALRRTNSALSERNEELADAVRARDIFLATASHELKTPLSTLALQVELLRRAADAGPTEAVRIGGSVDALQRQVERLTALVAQLLDVSRLAEGRMDFDIERFDVCELVHEVVSRFEPEAQRAGSTIHIDASEPAIGRWDRFRLDQIVSNLVSNAIKYGSGQPIDLTVRCGPQRVELVVRDRGVGIPEEAFQRIFERFERLVDRSTAGGIGLGLWIVRQIVEQFGGTISVQSTFGGGSRFTVTLPRDATSAP